jgi:integrase
MGHRGVEVRPGSLRLRFTWQGKACYPTLVTNGQPMAPTPTNIRYAERLVAEIREKIRLGSFSYAEYFPADGNSGEALTLGRQLTTWLDAQRIEASTRAGYSSACKFWREAVVDGLPLGERPLRALKHSDLLRALATRPGLSGKTVNNYVSVAREALALAVADGTLTANPGEKIPRASHQKEPPDPFSRDEVDSIIADLIEHYPEPIGNYVEWWAYSGVRPSEAAGLRWSHVDLASGYMQVREAIVRGVAKTNTKTSVARDVGLNSRALAALQRQRKHTQVAGDHVWLDPRYGTPWLEERAFRRSYWTPALKRLGIRYRSPRHLRHTYATMMLMAGRTPAWCARQLGHSVEMFLRTYSKWLGGTQDAQELRGLEDWLLTRPLPSKAAGGESS